MIGNLFRSTKRSRPERPTFRPVLESLEVREVPTAAQVSAIYNQLPTNVSNLEASLAARPANVNTINANLNTVSYDFLILKLGAPGFVVSNRLQIDNALVVDGIRLFYDGFKNYPFIPGAQFVSTLRLGASAVEAGVTDFLVTGFFPETSGNAILT